GRLTLDAPPRALATVTQESDHLSIKFEADALDVATPPLPEPSSKDLLQAVRVVDATTLAVDLGPRFAAFRATSQPVDTTERVVIDLLGQTDTAAHPAATGAGAAAGLRANLVGDSHDRDRSRARWRRRRRARGGGRGRK